VNIRSIPLLCAILFLLIVSAGTLLADAFPSVTLLHTPGSSLYTYHVVVPADSPYSFGWLVLYTKATSWNGSEETWSATGPQVSGLDMGWVSQFNWGDEGDTVEWRAYESKEVTSGPWEGDFILDAPGTVPVPGMAWTKDDVQDSLQEITIDVPGLPSVPEPSSLLALGGMIGLAIPALRRRVR
jgi:hypothetical protein